MVQWTVFLPVDRPSRDRISATFSSLLSLSLPRCEILSHISHFLLVFNSSINILIYCWKDAKFRALLLASLGLRTLAAGGASVGGALSRGGRQSSLLMVTMTAAAFPSPFEPDNDNGLDTTPEEVDTEETYQF